ncbi:MAG: trypsin-like peptidase domain-containing protein, partial [Cyanobacteria bacterium P01_C01_bin.38]
MIVRLFISFGGLTICTVIGITGINAVEKLLSDRSDSRYKLGYFDTAIAQTAEEQIARSVYKKASPAVVTVKDGKVHGSGFVVSQDGLIITNAHVVQGSPSVVTVVFADGKQLPADVMGFAKGGLDLAVLKIHRQKNLSALALAAEGSAEVGDRVFALGSPLSLNDTFTQGNINRIDRKDGRIQHDAVIQPGNSGGPLLNTKGQVIGVNTSQIGRTNIGINFAIPVSKLRSFVAAVRKGDLSPVSTLKKPSREPKFATISLNGEDINGKFSKENG